MDQIMKLLARILFMCILQCKTGTCWTTDPTMKLLASAQFMSILQCKTGTCTKIKLIKESPFRLRRYSRIKYHSKIMPMVTMCTFKNISESFMDCFYWALSYILYVSFFIIILYIFIFIFYLVWECCHKIILRKQISCFSLNQEWVPLSEMFIKLWHQLKLYLDPYGKNECIHPRITPYEWILTLFYFLMFQLKL